MNIKDDILISKINRGYLVGGAVRDFLMYGAVPFDKDIAIKNAEAFSRELAEKFDGTIVVLDDENKIFRVVLKDKLNYFDISELQGNSIEEDLLRRDFTINAIAYDLESEKFIDTIGGRNDIENKVIKHIKDENFTDDPLRILRAFRFASVTGFEIDKKTFEAVIKYKKLLLKPSKERISYELMKLFGGKSSSEVLLKTDECGVLELIFPVMKEVKKVPPNSHHHLDLLHHSIEAVRNIEILYREAPDEVKSHLDMVDFGGFPRINHLKLAGLLHDIGKPSTWTIEEDTGRHRFIKHDDLGAKMSVPVLKELKFSKKQIEYISKMIKTHIYPSNVISSPDLNEKVMMRYLRKMENDVIDNIILAKADRLSARGVEITPEIVENNINGLDKLLNFYLDKKDSLKPLPKLLDGIEIMELKGIKQSPALGEIISALKEAQISGDVNTKEEAKEFVTEYKL